MCPSEERDEDDKKGTTDEGEKKAPTGTSILEGVPANVVDLVKPVRLDAFETVLDCIVNHHIHEDDHLTLQCLKIMRAYVLFQFQPDEKKGDKDEDEALLVVKKLGTPSRLYSPLDLVWGQTPAALRLTEFFR